MTKTYNSKEVIITDDKGNIRSIAKEKLQINLDKMKSLKENIDNNVANIEFDLGEIAKA